MAIADDVLSILKVKIKPRKDSYSDQFSRIFLLKFMMVGAMFTGLTWYSDSINCLSVDLVDKGFAATSCWINGFYIFDEIKYDQNKLGYYGIPDDIKVDGTYADGGELCETKGNPNCRPMKKTFFLQYQYITFFLVAMGAIYYVPYVFFKFINTDLESLKGNIKEGNAESIVNNYFNRSVNPTSKLNMKVGGNFMSKILYIIANVLVFVLTDRVLNGGFQSYGIAYSKWASLNNTMAYDYMGRRGSPKPANVLLPSFLLCDVHEGAADIKHKVINQHTLICELSQHIVYQYIFLLLWWGMVFGIVVSVLGLFLLFIDYAFTMIGIRKSLDMPGSSGLCIRECEYLDYIRKKDLTLFGNVSQLLKDQRQPGLLKKKPIYNSQVEHAF